jgi:hypothetical protein
MVKNCLACGALNDADAQSCLVCGAEFTQFQSTDSNPNPQGKPADLFKGGASKYVSSSKNHLLYQFTPAPLSSPSVLPTTQVAVSLTPKAQNQSINIQQQTKKPVLSPIYRATASRGPKDDPFLLPDDIRMSAAPIAFPATSVHQHKQFMPHTEIGNPNPQTLNEPVNVKDFINGEDLSFLLSDQDDSISEQQPLMPHQTDFFQTVSMSNDSLFQEPIKQEPIKQEPIKQEPIKQELIKQEPIKQELIKQEPIKQEPIKQEAVHLTVDDLEENFEWHFNTNQLLNHHENEQVPIQAPIQAPAQMKTIKKTVDQGTAQHQRISDLLEQINTPTQASIEADFIDPLQALVNPDLKELKQLDLANQYQSDEKPRNFTRYWAYLFLLISMMFFSSYAYLNQTIDFKYQIKSIERLNQYYRVTIELDHQDQILLDAPENWIESSEKKSENLTIFTIRIPIEYLKIGTQKIELNWSDLQKNYPFSFMMTHHYDFVEVQPLKADQTYHIFFKVADHWEISHSNAHQIMALENQIFELVLPYEKAVSLKKSTEDQSIQLDFILEDEQKNRVPAYQIIQLPISKLPLEIYSPGPIWKRQDDQVLIIGKSLPKSQITVKSLTYPTSPTKTTTTNAFGIFEIQAPIRLVEQIQQFEVKSTLDGFEPSLTIIEAQRMQQQDWFNQKGALIAQGKQQNDRIYTEITQIDRLLSKTNHNDASVNDKTPKKFRMTARILWVSDTVKTEKGDFLQTILLEVGTYQFWGQIKNPQLKSLAWIQRNHQIVVYGSLMTRSQHVNQEGILQELPTIKIDHIYWF